MNATIMALLGYISWTLMLLVALVLYRTSLVLSRKRAPNGFKADGSDASPFGQRLTRAQANCVESFVFIGGLLMLALLAEQTAVTDGLAYTLLVARLGQSLSHLRSVSNRAVKIRFVFFLVQVLICIYWAIQMALNLLA